MGQTILYRNGELSTCYKFIKFCCYIDYVAKDHNNTSYYHITITITITITRST